MRGSAAKVTIKMKEYVGREEERGTCIAFREKDEKERKMLNTKGE